MPDLPSVHRQNETIPTADVDLVPIPLGAYTFHRNEKPHGKAIIFDNWFHWSRPKKEPLLGGLAAAGDNDATILEAQLKGLGFDVEVFGGLPSCKIQEKLECYPQVTTNPVTVSTDCLFVAFFTDGKDGCLWGSDQTKMTVYSLSAQFKADNCRPLAGKPKIFFVQVWAARGIKYISA